MSTILITGGTGLIGQALSNQLQQLQYDVIILTRDATKFKSSAHLQYAHWNVTTGEIDAKAVAAADHIIHLAGAGVAEKRWTKARKKEILDSRVKSGNLLVKALRDIPNKVQTVVAASAIGWYGPDDHIPNETPFTETAAAAEDFLGNTCKQWEESIAPVTKLGKRLVILRTGIVLSKKGGALKEFLKPIQFGLAAILGKGNQVVSWIHIEDMVRLYITAITNKDWQGVYNAVAPNAVSNKYLTISLAKQLKGSRYLAIHVPGFVLEILLGEMSTEVLKSATVSARKLQLAGFKFNYSTIEAAISATQ
jgi:uncharacterized protein